MTLFEELKRRKVFRVGAAYLVVAWLLIQVAATVAPQLQFPEWVPRLVTLILILGFPIAVVMAWVLDFTPEGVRVDATAAGTRRVLAFGIVLVLIALGWYFRDPEKSAAQVAASPEGAAIATGAAREGGTAPVPDSEPAAVQPVPRKSIAVLPFADLSPTRDQEYFSDGMAEELLNALAKVKDLKVAGRTSSFSFKGKDKDLRAIGSTLAVANVLEGSVRKQGDKVRITAQLIQVEDGYQLWSETYDGDLSDVFEVQERIARAIAQELELILQGEQKDRLVPEATTSTQAYSNYLRATAVFNRREGPRFAEAMSTLREAISLDPEFARAHSRLAALHALATSYTATDFEKSLADGEREARIAIELDPALAEPHAVLGLMYGYRRDFAEGLAALERAIDLDPQDVSTNFWMGTNLVSQGYVAKGLASLDRVLAIDPLLPNALAWRGVHYLDAGDRETARSMLEASVGQGLAFGEWNLAMVAHADGNDADAIRLHSRGARLFLLDFPEGSAERLARGLFGDATTREDAVAMIEEHLATRPRPIPGVAPWAMMMLGKPARALELAQTPTSNDSLFFNWLWTHWGKQVRTLPQFPAFVRKIGLAELWDRHGEPDLCRKRPEGEYACE